MTPNTTSATKDQGTAFLSSLDSLIKRSQLETQQLLSVLELLKPEDQDGGKGAVDVTPLLGLLDLEALKQEVEERQQQQQTSVKEEPDMPVISLPDEDHPTTPSSSPKRTLEEPHITVDDEPSPKRSRPSDDDMVFVPIQASFLHEVLNGDPNSSIPVSRILSAIGKLSVDSPQQTSTVQQQAPSTPPPSSSTSPATNSSSSTNVLRFCERRSNPHSVDVFHYLPADSKVSPFLKSSPSSQRKILDEITTTVISKPGRGRPPATIITSPTTTYNNGNLGNGVTLMTERTNYTPLQTERLEAAFAQNNFLAKDHREQLSLLLGIHASRIKVWFQNRRARRKREDQLKERIAAAAKSAAASNYSMPWGDQSLPIIRFTQIQGGRILNKLHLKDIGNHDHESHGYWWLKLWQNYISGKLRPDVV
eukprot:sb/3465024/